MNATYRKTYDVDALYREAETHDEYWAARAVLDFTETVVEEMERAGVSRAELARRIGSSPAYVSKILRGESNFTLASMVKLARALDLRLEVRLERQGEDRDDREAGGEVRAAPVAEPRAAVAAAGC